MSYPHIIHTTPKRNLVLQVDLVHYVNLTSKIQSIHHTIITGLFCIFM